MTTMILVLGLAYLVGAVPWSWLFARRAGLDLRRVGSGNLGATNAYRALGARGALPVLLLDIAKGAAPPFLVARFRFDSPLVGSEMLAALAGLAAIVGHIFPVYLRFRGGKGIATAAGAFLVIEPLACVLSILVFVVALVATRGIVSVGSLASAAALPVALFGVTAWRGESRIATVIVAGVVAVLVWCKHTTNLRRLHAGSEKRIFDRRASAAGVTTGSGGRSR